MPKKAAKQLKFEPLLIRIQVQRGHPRDAQLSWTILLQPGETFHSVIGNLKASGEIASGNAAAIAFLTPLEEGDLPTDLSFVKQWVVDHVAEVLYDVCRRALNSQASAMDLSLTIPMKAPAAEVADFQAAS